MAKKSFQNELKKEGKAFAKRSVKKGAKKLVREAADGLEGSDRKKRGAPRRSLALKIIPYCMAVLAVILVIFFVTVHIADAEAGWLGGPVQYALGGLFGGSALLVPIALGFFGVRWCIYNIKWRERYMDKDAEEYPDYKRAKGRIILQGIMIVLVILVVSSLFGVAAGYDMSDGFDLGEMWESGGEELFLGGGGVIGDTLGGLLVAAVRQVASYVILAVLLSVFCILMVGLTPDLIIEKLRDANARRREERLAQKEEEERLAEEERKAEQAAAKAAKPTRAAETTVSATFKNEKKESDAEYTPLSELDILDVTGSDSKKSEDGDIVSKMFDEPNKTPAKNTKKDVREAGGDYGGEPGFDADGEFDPIEDIINGLDTSTGEVMDIELPEDEPVIEIKAEDRSKEELKPISLSEITEEDIRSDMAAVAPDEGGDGEEEEEPPTPYIFPPIEMLQRGKNPSETNVSEELQANARQLVSTLQSFKINIKEINYSRGPTITRYELRPEAGVRVRSIANLVDDISLSLATSGVRIEAPIPGKAAVGIEVPNKVRATVFLRDLIDNSQFSDAKSKLTASLGMDVGGNPIYFDISKMPHMLIAGATGMGKSVCINCIIISLLYKARPEDLKLILIDPKKVEFTMYKDIPHLYAPIVSDPKKAAGALASAVAEMERRFELIEEVGVRDIASYNAITENDPYKEHMPHMVIIIDELADLMMTAPDEVETAICRLAQKARAAGIHIIIGTQRPSVDVITGLIKANIPSRIACTVASQVDSRTIIDIAGAEKLIGRGDMLFAPVGAAKPMRVQGAFVSDGEVESIVTFIRENNAKAKYNAEFINRLEEEAAKCGVKKGGSGGGDVSAIGGSDDGTDSKFQAAVKLAVEEGKISTSLMQRRLGVGYGRAAKIIDSMEEMGYVSKPDGNKPRRVLLTAEEYAKRVTEGTLGGDDE